MSVVLLHGFTGSPSSWDQVREHLRDGRADRPALVGHSGGPPADAETSWDGEVGRLAGLVAAAGEPVTLAGYSLGARLALAVALRTPAAVARLVLVAPSEGLAAEGERRERRDADDALAVSIVSGGLAAFVDRWEALPIFASQARLPSTIRREHRTRRLAHDPRSLAAALSALSKGRMPHLLPELRRLPTPTTLLVGSLDAAAARSAARMAAELPRARVEVVAGAGHDLVLERPSAVAAALEGREAYVPERPMEEIR
jgi:2-succinyl-6-hydroxy-2,4-cyclohexadiene-1-carboxylate synthase